VIDSTACRVHADAKQEDRRANPPPGPRGAATWRGHGRVSVCRARVGISRAALRAPGSTSRARSWSWPTTHCIFSARPARRTPPAGRDVRHVDPPVRRPQEGPCPGPTVRAVPHPLSPGVARRETRSRPLVLELPANQAERGVFGRQSRTSSLPGVRVAAPPGGPRPAQARCCCGDGASGGTALHGTNARTPPPAATRTARSR